MSHNLMNRNGRDAMFVVGDRDAAWHKLGQRTPECVNWLEAMRLAGLDWAVEKRQLFARVAMPNVAEPIAAVLAPFADSYRPIEAYGIFRTDDNQFLGSGG